MLQPGNAVESVYRVQPHLDSSQLGSTNVGHVRHAYVANLTRICKALTLTEFFFPSLITNIPAACSIMHKSEVSYVQAVEDLVVVAVH